MCGICGVCFTPSGNRVDPSLLERMCASITHRGPDDQGIHLDGAVGLGMRRLSIIDLDTGSQPILNEDRSVVAVFNGEIYNYKELRKDLQSRGHRFETQGDTEVILHLYEEYGVDFPTHLNGMFAIALWDRTRQRFMLVRDRLGQKPVYYSSLSDGLVFGSELKSLLQYKDLPRELDQEAVYHYFSLGYIPHPYSIYKSVRQLPPAHRLIMTGSKMQVEPYWSLDSSIDQSVDYEDKREEIRALLTDSVRLRMMSDVPLGGFLSGGLDSSITVALMAQQSTSPIKTFHIDFGEPKESELAFARQVSQRYGTQHHELVVTPSAINILDKVVNSFDEPFADASAIPTFFVSQLTREHVTVALAGDGGDESFGGYVNYQRILSRRNLPNFIRAGLGVAGKTIHACLPRSAPGRRYFRSLGMSNLQFFAVGTSELETRELLSQDFLASINRDSTFDLLRPHMEKADPDDHLARYTSLDIKHYMPDDILTKVDRMSMAHSLEVRSPFMDYRVFELAARLPHHWKIKGNNTKVILSDAFADDLPSEIRQRRKRGFSMPLAKWLRGELRDLLNEAINDTEIASSGIFRISEIRAMAREHFSGKRDRAVLLWRYLFFVRWWRQQYRRDQQSHIAAPLETLFP